MKRARTGTYKKAGPYKRTRNAAGSSARNPIIIPDAQVRRVMNARTGGYIGLEKKFFDSSASAAIVSTADASGGEIDPTTLLCLNCPAQGDGEQNRDGRQINMHSIYIKGVVSMAAQANQTSLDVIPEVMIALVLDKQTNGAQLNSEDVYDNPSGFSTLAAQPFRELEYSKRFQVLKTVNITAKDIAGTIQPVYDGTNIEQQGGHVPFTIYKDLKGMKVNYISGQTTSVINAIADNSLHIIAFCSNVGTVPTLLYQSRLRFTG